VPQGAQSFGVSTWDRVLCCFLLPRLDRPTDVALRFGTLTVLAIKNVRRLAERHLPQPAQVLGREKVRQCGFNSFFGVNLAGLKPLKKIFRR
jgi:hypothetical protein